MDRGEMNRGSGGGGDYRAELHERVKIHCSFRKLITDIAAYIKPCLTTL